MPVCVGAIPYNTDRLAKETYRNDMPVLYIDHKFTSHHWIIEFNHRNFINCLYQAQLFNCYISFQRNRNLYDLMKRRLINWSLIYSYMTYDYNEKQSTSFNASFWSSNYSHSQFQQSRFLKIEHPHLYNNYSWTCSNDVLCIEYRATTQTMARCKENKSDHVFLCEIIW